jgi:hypothetical protein
MTTENGTEAKASEATVNPEMKGGEKTGGLLERSRKCPECGHENPISRVTCLKCSARLFKPTKRDEAKLISKKAKKTLEKKAEEKAEMKKVKKATAAKPKKEKKVRGAHDNQKLRDCFAKKGTWTMGELKKATGFDEDHIRYTLNVFRNKNRTKDPMVTDYDKEKETFKLLK